MEVVKDRIKKLNDDVLRGVSGGLETELPLRTSVVTDDTQEEDKKREEKNRIN